MYLYGEFGFALLGLKPCVLVDFRSKDTIQQYANQVIEPVLNSLKGRNLSWMKIENTSTPECDLNDCILVYNINQTELVNEIFLSTNRSKVIPEDTLARLLDYPGKLPSSPEDVRLMKTVIYYHQTVDTKELVAVTTYAMLDYEKEKVISHFKRYQSICETALGMQLRLLIR
ncbi:hypothetical protein BDB01DRAFT_717236 [Pilobolus umbonatus]|nr:hypothetical protein BDB01DRAFT_717236 [Pilobolus umbonatus]